MSTFDDTKSKNNILTASEEEFGRLYADAAKRAFGDDKRFYSEELTAYLYGVYVSLAAGAKRFNLTSIIECGAVIEKHFIDSLLPLKILVDNGYIEDKTKIIDVGCGAGFPSLPFAAAFSCGEFPRAEVYPVDSTAKKIRYIGDAAARIGVKGAYPRAGRAEELARGAMREKFDIATARAVAALPVLLELTAPFVKIGGIVAAYKARANEEIASASNAASVLGLDEPEVVSYNLPSGDARTLVIYKKIRKTQAEYPRVYTKIVSKTL